MSNLFQPIFSNQPEYGHNPQSVLSFDEFIALLKAEEDYFNEEAMNTKLMITRLRKIFYGEKSWDTQLISNAANIDGRYLIKEVDCGANFSYTIELNKIKYYNNTVSSPKCKLVTYRKNDRIYGDTKHGQVPDIYKNDHQDIYLTTENHHCDIAHVLGGLDAINHPQQVGPGVRLPSEVSRYFPKVKSNLEVVTWLGDIATTAADFLLTYLRNGNTDLTEAEMQFHINANASASDMLGNIDPYVISKYYDIAANSGYKVSDILIDYYNNNEVNAYRQKRITVFCELIGLRNWNGSNFSNEAEWLAKYTNELRITTCFMIFSMEQDSVRRITIPIAVQNELYEQVIKLEMLLKLFIQELKKHI